MIPFGFGSYRIAEGDATHEAALRHALDRGITLIDTSTNYSDGASELLIGRVLLDHTHASSVELVTKAGYIQGTTLDRAQARIQNGDPFPEVVQVQESLWHCIAPEFLEDQLMASMQRLQRTSIDVLLLHNPEYFLLDAHQRGIPIDDARRHFYRRIRNAFQFLEECVLDGRIVSYGISSNTFPCEPDDPGFCSLEECLAIADRVAGHEHHFRTIQLPMNIIEHHAATVCNQRDRSATVLELASEHALRVLVNRPLNGVIEDDLIRLATHPLPATMPLPDEVDARIHTLEIEEHQAAQLVLQTLQGDGKEAAAIQETFKVAAALCQSWRSFSGLPHWNDIVSMYLQPRIHVMQRYVADASDPVAMQHYMDGLRSVLNDITALYAHEENLSLAELRAMLADECGMPLDAPLQHIALHAVRCTAGVSVVLVGMRTPAYVDDVLASLELPPISLHRASWLRIVGHLARLSEQGAA